MYECDHPPESPRHTAGSPERTEQPIDTDELLSVLGDNHTREILTIIGEESLPAREIAERLDISRPTVYRRLNRLESLGVVEGVMSIHSSGQHRQEFRVVLDEVTLSLTRCSVVETPDDKSEPEMVEQRRMVSLSD